MKLKDYLYFNEIKVCEFGKMINYEPTYVSAIIHMNKKFGRKFIEAVVKATDGAVTREDMRTLNLLAEKKLSEEADKKYFAECNAKNESKGSTSNLDNIPLP